MIVFHHSQSERKEAKVGYLSCAAGVRPSTVIIRLRSRLVIGNWAGPTGDELQEVYVETCQASCAVVTNEDQANECRNKFCPSYTNYLLTGFSLSETETGLVSSKRKEAANFCATWLVNLVQELGWQRRNQLNRRDCFCAASKDCFVQSS